MEISSRKRVSTAAPSGLPTQGAGYSSSSIVSEYGRQVAAQAANAASSGGLSSGTRLSYGTASGRAQASALSMYNDAPQEQVTLDQFERAGVDRLQAHKQAESMRLRKGALLSKHALANDPVDSPMSQILSKFNLNNPAWDNLSHFVLRLAYCKTEELRRWLITQESALFKYRFDTENEETISTFLRENGLEYEPLTSDELDAVIPHSGVSAEEARSLPVQYLRDLLHRVPFADPHQSVYYKVPFEDAIDLLRERKVYLRAGYAFVSRANLSAIITTKFRANLSLHLGQTCRATAQIKQDVRIQPLVSMLSKQYITPMYRTAKIEGAVTKEQLPTLADRSMPLCMSTLFSALKKDNHLRHGGRMQLGLFLKGIGLSLNDALLFWKQSFARKTPPEKFDKEYAYNIRHNYGKEGKRASYTPYGCVKIIMSDSGGPDDHHGCPFKNFDEARLRLAMRKKSCNKAQEDEVIALVKGHFYQIACQRYYQHTHGGQLNESVGNHPNAYFDASEQWHREQEGKTATAGGAAGAANPTQSQGASQATSGSEASYNAFATQGSAQTSTPAARPPTAAPVAAAPAAAAPADGPAPMDTRPDSPAPATAQA